MQDNGRDPKKGGFTLVYEASKTFGDELSRFDQKIDHPDLCLQAPEGFDQ